MKIWTECSPINSAELTIIGNPIDIKRIHISSNGINNILRVGENVSFGNVVLEFRGDNNYIEISNNTVIRGKILVDKGSVVKIGEGTIFNFNSAEIEARESTNVLIGQKCLLSQVRIVSSDVHSIFDLDSKEKLNKPKDIIIHDKVWIAFDVLICKGTEIGANSVVGAKSLVAGRYPRNCVIAGNPARIVKTNIIWDTKSISQYSEI